MLIYCHKRKDTNEVFYIGQSVDLRRTTSARNRNAHWHNVVNKHGYYAEIIADNLSKEKADALEKFLIREYGRIDLRTGCLVNMTEGGEGISSEKRKLWWKTRTPEQLEAIRAQRKATFKKNRETSGNHGGWKSLTPEERRIRMKSCVCPDI